MFFLLAYLLRLVLCPSQWHPTPVLLPGKSHGWRSLVGRSPWGRYKSDMTEWLHFHFSLSCIGEGNGNPLQCSCLENPRDGGAWWAAISGVTQSWTWLKRLSSSSIWSLLENVPCVLEKNMYFGFSACNVLRISIKSNCFILSFIISIALLIFCLEDLCPLAWQGINVSYYYCISVSFFLYFC